MPDPDAPSRPVPAAPLAPVVATIVVIFGVSQGRLRVLLVRRSGPPERDRWALPGGRWDGVEELETAATRVLERETGVTDLYLEQLFTAASLDRASPSLAVAYFALVEASTVRLREEEEWRPAWHPINDLPELAFQNNDVIEQAVARVGAKLEYTNIAFGLLPAEFTFRQLHETYEAILRKPLDRRNFRKRMLSMGIIQPTGGTRREGAHRPARLYHFTSREPVFL